LNQIHVTFRHVDPSQPLKDYAVEKLGRLQKVIEKPFDANVTLTVEKYRHIAEVFMTAPGITIKAFESTEDLYSAIDLVCDKVERQLKKYREKQKDKGQGVPAAQLPFVSSSSITVSSGEEAAHIVRADNYLSKPMTVEDAAKHLDILRVDVLMFMNQETELPSVVFRQADGSVGFTEPVGK